MSESLVKSVGRSIWLHVLFFLVRQKPGCEDVCSLIPALEVMLAQWKELLSCMVELCQLAREHGDPHTASTVKGCFLAPLVPKVKELGDLLTNAKRVGCGGHKAGFGEYLIDQLLEKLSGIWSCFPTLIYTHKHPVQTPPPSFQRQYWTQCSCCWSLLYI